MYRAVQSRTCQNMWSDGRINSVLLSNLLYFVPSPTFVFVRCSKRPILYFIILIVLKTITNALLISKLKNKYVSNDDFISLYTRLPFSRLQYVIERKAKKPSCLPRNSKNSSSSRKERNKSSK